MNLQVCRKELAMQAGWYDAARGELIRHHFLRSGAVATPQDLRPSPAASQQFEW